jgi:ABC-2 type transport system ATP-binding protein
MTDLAIDITGLTKIYPASGRKEPKLALDDVSLKIPKGSVYGLLGPNGAGKSTLINIMAGLVIKSSGTVKIWDIDMNVDPRNAKSAIGVVPQEINYDPFFSPEKLLDIQAGLYGVPKAERRTKELLKLVGLQDHAKAYTRALSGGMRRRLMVAKAMVHAPPILVLDEPTAGVDVELRQQL